MSRYDEDEEMMEIDPHMVEKERRQKRIKGKKQDKNKDQFSDGHGKKVKLYKHKRHEEKQALQEMIYR